jgi:hypothetical protein
VTASPGSRPSTFDIVWTNGKAATEPGLSRDGRSGLNTERARVAAQVLLGAVSGAGMALAAFLLIAPDVSPAPLFPFQDKAYHAVAFGCLTGPAVLVLPRRYQLFWLAHMLMLGGGIEIAQVFGANGRSGSVGDFLADAVGIGAAMGIGRAIRALFEVDRRSP